MVVDWQKVVDAEAEALILMPCGFSLERSLREGRTTLIDKPGWANLPAVKTGEHFFLFTYFILDSHDSILLNLYTTSIQKPW